MLLPRRRGAKGFLYGDGGLVDSLGNHVQDFSTEINIEGSYVLDSIEYQDKKIVYLGYFIDLWGHLLIDWSIRLWYFFKDDTTIDEYVYITNENTELNIDKNYKDFFVLLGIWDKKYIFYLGISDKKTK